VKSSIVELDSHCCAIFLEIPPRGVVLLQAVIESYENLGVVRTIDPTRGLVCVVTTRSGVATVGNILDSLKEQCSWRFVAEISQDMKMNVIPGYSHRGKQ